MSNDELNPDLAAALQKFASWWDDQERTIDAQNKITTPQYHYTSIGGLAGIIKDQELWFSSIFHLNDPSEFLYGVSIACDVLHEEASRVSSRVDKVYELICREISRALRGNIPERFAYFVTSFSGNGDELGQWRAYADDGKGVALGFAPHTFQYLEVASDQVPLLEKVFVTRVEYDQSIARANIRAIIDKMREIISAALSKAGSISADQGGFLIKHACMTLTAPLLWHCITTKHSAYRSEDETRLLVVNEKNLLAEHIRTRVRDSNLVPYVASPAKVRTPGHITEIVVGPDAPIGVEESIKTLLLSQGMSWDVPIRRSDIPYRSYRR